MSFNSKIEEHIYYSNTFNGNSIKEDLIEYCNRILDGRIIACKKHKWTCERFLNDLEKSNKNLEEFPYRFDELEAQRAIDWIEEFKHSKGE